MAERDLPDPGSLAAGAHPDRHRVERGGGVPRGARPRRRGRLRAAVGPAGAVGGVRAVACRRRPPDRASPCSGTVLVTGAAGWAFGRLYERSGSLAAPMLAHLAINEAGALAALGRAADGRARLGVARVRLEQMRVGVVSSMPKLMIRRGVIRMIAVSSSSPAGAVAGGASACSAVPRISRQRTRHGSRRGDVVDDEGHRGVAARCCGTSGSSTSGSRRCRWCRAPRCR